MTIQIRTILIPKIQILKKNNQRGITQKIKLIIEKENVRI